MPDGSQDRDPHGGVAQGFARPGDLRAAEPPTARAFPPAPARGPEGIDWTTDDLDVAAERDAAELEELLRLLDAVWRQFRGPDATERASIGPGSATPVAGSGAEAAENRSIRCARSALARGDAELLAADLGAARARVERALERARQCVAEGQARRRAAGDTGSR